MRFETQAAVFRGEEASPFRIEAVRLDDLRPKEILVSIQACGVCHMDIAGPDLVPAPAIYGHEGVGIVEAVGSAVTKVKRGERVVMAYGSCGACRNCEGGEPYHCDDSWKVTFSGRRFDGTPTAFAGGTPIAAAFFQQSSFARHAITLEDSVVRVISDTSSTMLAALPCGVMTGVGVVTEHLSVRAGEAIAIFGAGTVGLSGIMAAKLVGAYPIIAIDINESRLELAAELGATHMINARGGDVAAKIRSIVGRGVQFAIDTTGNAEAFRNAIESIGVGGVLAACILPSPIDTFEFRPAALFEKAASLSFVSFGNAAPRIMIPKLIGYFERGQLPIDRIAKPYAFEDINAACRDSKSGNAVKPVLEMT